MTLAFPKPGEIRKKPVVERVFKDGRTKLNLLVKAGMDEYLRRRRVAWEAQDKKCGICKLKLNWGDATTDHVIPKGHGGGTHDDRQENVQAAHLDCNIKKASQRNYRHEFADVP